MYFNRYKVHEVISMLEQLDDLESADVYITPPLDAQLSEEDSDDDDDPKSINHLSGQQLNAEADVRLTTTSHKTVSPADECNSQDTSDEEDSTPLAALMSTPADVRKPRSTQCSEPTRKWSSHKDLQSDSGCTQHEPTKASFLEKEWTPVELFELFFDTETLQFLVENTQKYAHDVKGDHSFALDQETLKVFFAVLLLSGYAVLPRRRMYWEQQPDVWNAAVATAMPRKKFEDLLRYFHISDNSRLQANDRFAKVRPLLASLNERWLLFKSTACHLSIDETMIPYFGKHGCKQHIHGKPIRFGYKMWSLASSDGYLLQGEPYQGASTSCDIPGLGMGGSVVMDLVSELPRDHKYSLYFDNLFTSLPLLDRLAAEGFGATGTLRMNRTKKAPLKNPKDLLKTPRGSHYFLQDETSGSVIVQWHDSNIVTLASNCHSVEPLGQARRWSHKEKKIVTISQPHTIAAYNKYMGGVDRLDQNVATYRISIRTKKWWWPLFSFLISATVNNAWLLYRDTETYKTDKLDLLEFTRRIVNAYLQKYGSRPKSKAVKCTPRMKRVLPEVRFDHQDHIIESIPKQRRCGHCGKKVLRQCAKCTVPLHVDCFGAFHGQ